MSYSQQPFASHLHPLTTIGSSDLVQKAEHFVHPNECDVLSGRGGFVNAHPGNVRFRELVHGRKTEYSLETNKERKMEICREVIALVHNSGGQFLAKETGSSLWKTMSDERIVAKTNQALREGAPKIREAFQEKAKRTFRGKRAFQASSSPVLSPVSTQTKKPQQTFFPIMDQAPLAPIESRVVSEDFATQSQEESGQRSATVSPNFDSFNGDDGYCSGDSIRQLFDLAAAPTAIPSMIETSRIPNEFDELERIQKEAELQRKHSLILSDISPSPTYLQEEFQNPFQNESWFLNTSNSDAGIGSLFNNSLSTLQRGVSSSLPQEYSV